MVRVLPQKATVDRASQFLKSRGQATGGGKAGGAKEKKGKKGKKNKKKVRFVRFSLF